MIHSIFIPIELVSNTNHIIHYGAQVAKAFNARITFFHASPIPYATYPAGAASLPQVLPFNPHDETELVTKELENILEEIPALRNIEYQVITLPGMALDLIPEAARNTHADLVIMSTHGASGFQKIIGTVAEQVTREATCPVLVIPKGYEYKAMRHIVLALTEDSIERNIHLDVLVQLAKKFTTNIDLVTVRNNADHPEEMFQTMCDRLKREGLSDQMDHNSFHAIQADNEEEAIMNYIEMHQVDLLTIVFREHGLLKRLFDPGLRKKMTFHTEVPLLVLK